MKQLITKIFGTKHERDVKKMQPLVDEINQVYATLQDLTDEELQAKTPEFRERLANGETVDDLLPDQFPGLSVMSDRPGNWSASRPRGIWCISMFS